MKSTRATIAILPLWDEVEITVRRSPNRFVRWYRISADSASWKRLKAVLKRYGEQWPPSAHSAIWVYDSEKQEQ